MEPHGVFKEVTKQCTNKSHHQSVSTPPSSAPPATKIGMRNTILQTGETIDTLGILDDCREDGLGNGDEVIYEKKYRLAIFGMVY